MKTVRIWTESGAVFYGIRFYYIFLLLLTKFLPWEFLSAFVPVVYCSASGC